MISASRCKLNIVVDSNLKMELRFQSAPHFGSEANVSSGGALIKGQYTRAAK
jgi:hypothetical protein